jgi:predicted acetyltransferase
MHLDLINPTLAREHEFMAMIEEFLAVGEHEYVYEEVLFGKGFAAYVEWLLQGERGELQGLVPWSAYWAVERSSGALVGMSSLRHDLSPWMARFGGHIGYRVRPSSRRLGAGTAILDLTVQRARARGIDPVLVVCTPENVGSQGVLRKNGAVFDKEVSTEGVRLNRYWIPAVPEDE